MTSLIFLHSSITWTNWPKMTPQSCVICWDKFRDKSIRTKSVHFETWINHSKSYWSFISHVNFESNFLTMTHKLQLWSNNVFGGSHHDLGRNLPKVVPLKQSRRTFDIHSSCLGRKSSDTNLSNKEITNSTACEKHFLERNIPIKLVSILFK